MAAINNEMPLSVAGHAQVSRLYAWTVFALTFGLALSDYLSRQVAAATFPFLKAEWGLSDAQLGGLASIVALSAAVFAIPVSLIADRYGRVKSITIMAVIWCTATVACGMAKDYSQLMAARGLVGIAEAAYYSAGLAILAYIFPQQQRATVFGIMIAGGMIGSVFGVVLGGILATQYGWREAFIIVGAPGLLLAAIYPMVVRDYETVALDDSAKAKRAAAHMSLGQLARAVVSTRSSIYVYLASGVQMMMTGVIISWMPSYFNRAYQMPPDRAAAAAGGIVLILGIGLTLGGIVTDRFSKGAGHRRARINAIYSALSGVLLIAGFGLGGTVGLVFLGLGALIVGGPGGSSIAIVSEVTHPAARVTVFATMTLGNGLLGLASGPFLVGRLSDVFGLPAALCVVSLSGFIAFFLFLGVAKHYPADRLRFQENN